MAVILDRKPAIRGAGHGKPNAVVGASDYIPVRIPDFYCHDRNRARQQIAKLRVAGYGISRTGEMDLMQRDGVVLRWCDGRTIRVDPHRIPLSVRRRAIKCQKESIADYA